MGFTEHFTIFYISRSALAPCSYMVGIHFRNFVNTGFVGIVTQSTERTIGNSLLLSGLGLSFIRNSFG